MSKPYTVLLLYPDYIANNYGQDTYLACVEAPNVELAVGLAQDMAAAASKTPGNKDEDEHDPDDFYPLLTIAGHHDDLTPR